jgi:dTDP-4-dehydrorhamnose 3,5-epimerase
MVSEPPRFTFDKLDIPEVILATCLKRADARGSFTEAYRYSYFKENGIPDHFVQDNLSVSKKGVLRGMHYQLPPSGQSKLVGVLRGEIVDVAIDIRRSSPTFLKYVAVRLSEDQPQLVYVPAGFAHGFCVLSDEAVVLYKCGAEFDPVNERGIAWDSPEVGVKWPANDWIISDRDRAQPTALNGDLFD